MPVNEVYEYLERNGYVWTTTRKIKREIGIVLTDQTLSRGLKTLEKYGLIESMPNPDWNCQKFYRLKGRKKRCKE